jgi:putative phosphoribosyl transferase
MAIDESLVTINAAEVVLEGILSLPKNATSLIIFVHGSGSSRHSPRNKAVAEEFNEYGLGTLLFDLLTLEEEKIDLATRELRFDIPKLADRVVGTLQWLERFEKTQKMNLGLIGSSTGAAAALVAAANYPKSVHAIVSRGGRPDLAGKFLLQVRAPTLLIVGAEDFVVIDLNKQAFSQLNCEKKLELVPGATHLFEERGTLEQASHLARNWFLSHL